MQGTASNPSVVQTLPGLLACLAFVLAQSAGAQTPKVAGQGPTIDGLVGGGVQYEERRSQDKSVRTYAMPVFLPLEAGLGRLFLGSSLEYQRKELSDNIVQARNQGIGYVNMDARLRAIDAGKLKVGVSESAGIAAANRQDQADPAETRIPGGYRLDSGLNFLYRLERFNLEMKGNYLYYKTRSEFRPGDVRSGGLALGYGFGGYNGEYAPVNLMLGFSSRFYEPDRLSGEEMRGTEYGTIFFSPGLILSGKSIMFRAGVDVPVRHMGPEDQGYRDRVRANIGLKYYFE